MCSLSSRVFGFVVRRSPRKRGNISDPVPTRHITESSASGAGPFPGNKRRKHVRQIPNHASWATNSVDSESSKKQNEIYEEESKIPNQTLEGDNYELRGIPFERFEEKHFAQIFQCNICLNIPTEARILLVWMTQIGRPPNLSKTKTLRSQKLTWKNLEIQAPNLGYFFQWPTCANFCLLGLGTESTFLPPFWKCVFILHVRTSNLGAFKRRLWLGF